MIDWGFYTYKNKKKKPIKGLVFTKSGKLDKRCKINRDWQYENVINDFYGKKMVERAEVRNPLTLEIMRKLWVNCNNQVFKIIKPNEKVSK
jgi:hypothetical protein